MKIGEGTIHANHGKVLDCTMLVGVECDGETIAFRFPALERDDDNIGPMVYAHLRGTELRVTFCDREDSDIEFAWNEGTGKWRNVGTANATNQTRSEAE
jgi:hypothetical protein